jgi:hypothetical protein
LINRVLTRGMPLTGASARLSWLIRITGIPGNRGWKRGNSFYSVPMPVE